MNDAPRRRPRLQFSITALLLLMVPIACGADAARRWWQNYLLKRPMPSEAYSAEGVEQHLKAGRTVLLDFTADWHPSCKHNWFFAIDVSNVRSFCRKHDVAVMHFDCSSYDPAVKALLNHYGSQSIPLTVVIPAQTPDEPIILRDALKSEQVLDALEEAVKRE